MNYYGKDGKGEICVKGPIVFQGYYGDAKKTASVIDENGYLHTGDIGEWDEVSLWSTNSTKIIIY